MRRLLLFLISLMIVGFASAQSSFDVAVECIKRYEGLHTVNNLRYVGYGHRVLTGEHFSNPMSEESADSLLRVDLLRKCTVFRKFGRDSLLLGILAYNVGETRVLKSQLIEKLRNGDRDIYTQYISFCHINGKVSERLLRRRKEEYELLFNK